MSCIQSDLGQTSVRDYYMRRELHDPLGQEWQTTTDSGQSSAPDLAALSADNITHNVLGHLVGTLAPWFLHASPLIPDLLSGLLVV